MCSEHNKHNSIQPNKWSSVFWMYPVSGKCEIYYFTFWHFTIYQITCLDKKVLAFCMMQTFVEDKIGIKREKKWLPMGWIEFKKQNNTNLQHVYFVSLFFKPLPHNTAFSRSKDM